MTISDKKQCKTENLDELSNWPGPGRQKNLTKENLSAERGDAVFKRQRQVQNGVNVVKYNSV